MDAQACKVVHLKEKLKSLGLSTSGTKPDLLSRLSAWDPTEVWFAEIVEKRGPRA